MINNVNHIVTENIGKMEWILKELAKEAIESANKTVIQQRMNQSY